MDCGKSWEIVCEKQRGIVCQKSCKHCILKMLSLDPKVFQKSRTEDDFNVMYCNFGISFLSSKGIARSSRCLLTENREGLCFLLSKLQTSAKSQNLLKFSSPTAHFETLDLRAPNQVKIIHLRTKFIIKSTNVMDLMGGKFH